MDNVQRFTSEIDPIYQSFDTSLQIIKMVYSYFTKEFITLFLYNVEQNSTKRQQNLQISFVNDI